MSIDIHVTCTWSSHSSDIDTYRSIVFFFLALEQCIHSTDDDLRTRHNSSLCVKTSKLSTVHHHLLSVSFISFLTNSSPVSCPRQQIMAALNAQTAVQFQQYAAQQYPNSPEQQLGLIRQLQEQHYQQYMQQLYQVQLAQQQVVCNPNRGIDFIDGYF